MPAKARTKPSAEIRRHKECCGVFDPTFLCLDIPEETPALTAEQTKAVAAAFKARFDLWWNSWIEPELEYLAKRGK